MVSPLVHEITYLDPLLVFSVFAQQDGALFLDSAQLREGAARYSFIAVNPFQTLLSKDAVVRLNDQIFHDDPFTVLEKQLALFPIVFHAELPPFQGGIAGYFGFDLCHHLEILPFSPYDDMQFPDLAVGFYDLVIGFDLLLQRAWIFSSGYPLHESPSRLQRAEARCQWLLKKLPLYPPLLSHSSVQCLPEEIQANHTTTSYQQGVKQVIDYILAGDIFEANLSQRFSAVLPENLSAFQLYCRLRLFNPAPFAAYLCFGDTILASASPERFLQLIQNKVETRPIKGTRQRSADAEKDAEFAQELLQSKKDHAENVMIVDLLRNDLSKVCLDHSVKVPQLCGLESYATVHHLVSVVVGELQKPYHAIDLLRATFPGGSITGAPKIRAMEIIAEIEPNRRGPYCGSIGYIGFNGDMDCSIVIRTFAIKAGKVTFQAGGAVVADSDPVTEYEETLIKIQPLIRALTEAI